MDEILTFLAEQGIAYDLMRHEQVHSIEDCLPNAAALNAVMPRNLFLTPRNESTFVLAIVPPLASFRTAAISKQLGLSRLSFATPERLMEKLRVTPGAVSPLELLFDKGNTIRFAMDRALLNEPRLAFHPADDTATVAMATKDFLKLMAALNRTVEQIDTAQA